MIRSLEAYEAQTVCVFGVCIRSYAGGWGTALERQADFRVE